MVLESNLGAASTEPIEEQGVRAAREVRDVVHKDHRIFSSYSIIGEFWGELCERKTGHSLGGLVARAAAAELRDLQLQPRAFVSIFTPHAGVEGVVAKQLLPGMAVAGGVDRGALKDLLEEDVEKSVSAAAFVHQNMDGWGFIQI